jgi:hypothetical protein
MQLEKISIIIPCFNDHLFIEQAIDSALAQTWPEKEIIVVDDGSDESTKTKLKSLNSKIDLVITQENKGVSVARNRGIAAAKGSFIMILDSDDYYEKDFCEKAIRVFHDRPDVKLVTCHARWFQSENDYRNFEPPGGDLKDFLIKNCALSAIFRKNDCDLAGDYDEKMLKGYEDWEFYIRLLKTGGYAEVIPEVLFNYRNKQNSRNKKANLAKYAIMEYIYNKHAELYKEHFSLFIHEWLKSNKKSEAFKQQVMDSLDYKIGFNLLKPLRAIGMFKKKMSSMK